MVKDPEKLAEEHWKWLEGMLGYLYKTAFIHGYIHALEAENKQDESKTERTAVKDS